MSRKILFVNPNLMKPAVTPVALDYLAQAVEDRGFEGEVLDLSFIDEPEQEIARRLSRDDYLLVAISIRNIDDSYFASRDFCLRQTKAMIDLIRLHTDAPVVLGGVGFSIFPAEGLSYCGVDVGIKGEGEWSLPLLAEKVAQGADYTGIPGAVFCRQGAYVQNPVRYGPLKEISLARRTAVDNPRYLREGAMVGFETKRGCDQGCGYCADPLSKGRLVRCRDPKDVAAELASLEARGVDYFHTCDSEFNIPERHAVEVCREITRRHLDGKIRWYAYASPGNFTEELADAMRSAGCLGIDFGVDHGNEEMLRRLGRRYTAEDIRSTARLARERGFSFMFDLLLGTPGETRDTIHETMELMKELSPDRVGISLGMRMYPGTPLTRQIVTGAGFDVTNGDLHGVIAGNETMLQPVFYLPADLGEDIEEFIEREIAGDPRFLLGSRKQLNRNYNYNTNSRLMEGIHQGLRGAFWDILRRMGDQTQAGSEAAPPVP